MQQEQIQQEIVESPQFSELRLIFQQFNNTYLIGPNGSGKTTAVHYSLQQLQIPFRRINLMLCPNKQSLLKAIVKEINQLWSVQISPSTKFSEFIIKLHNIVFESNQKIRRSYIVIDAPQQPIIEFIYLKKLFALSEIRTKNTSINFIYICNQLPYLEEMPLGITYFYKYLDEKLLVMVIFQQIMVEAMKLEDFSVQNIHEIRTMAFETAKDVVVTYSIFTRNLHILNQIAIALFSNFVYKCTSVSEQEQNQIKIQYKLAKKILMENPYQQINSKDFQLLIEKQLSRRNDSDNKQNLVERKNAAQTLESSKIKLPKIPALLLLSSFYASRNPEKTDQILFGDLKKNKKSKQKEQLKVKQKVSLHRLIAICQSLMSITEPNQFSIEKQYFSQSVVFYEQIQILVELGFIKQYTKKDDSLNKVKFECQITEKQAFDLAQFLNIPFDEFLAKY